MTITELQKEIEQAKYDYGNDWKVDVKEAKLEGYKLAQKEFLNFLEVMNACNKKFKIPIYRPSINKIKELKGAVSSPLTKEGEK